MEFDFLEEFTKRGHFDFDGTTPLVEAVVDSCIPYQPGVYLIYELKNQSPDRLLYYGKSGTTAGKLNNHQLPRRILATARVTEEFREAFGDKEFVSRPVYWPNRMEQEGIRTIRIYWFITWPTDPLVIERKIRNKLGDSTPAWNK